MTIKVSRILQIAVCLLTFTLAATAATQPGDPYSILSSWVQQAELTASDGQPNDAFGISTAISGNTMVIGAPFHQDQGLAYVFTESNGVWTQVAELTASDAVNGLAFGISVAISGNTIVVGADACCTFFADGAAYVFVKPATGWTNMTETAKLTDTDQGSFDGFGISVAISSDTIVVGADQRQIGSNQDQGTVFVFVKPAHGWINATPTAALTASDGAQQDELGFSVAIQGNTVVAGAEEATLSSFFGAGAAYVFVKPSTGWANTNETAKLTATDPNFLDTFGTSVAVSDDESTIVAGAPRHPVRGGINGAAYIFVMPASGWQTTTQTAELLAPGPALLFGFVSINGPGTIVAVGAPGTSSNSGIFEGTAYVYRKPATGWPPTPEANARLNPPAPQQGGIFGRSVALRGRTVVVGEAGAVLVFEHQ